MSPSQAKSIKSQPKTVNKSFMALPKSNKTVKKTEELRLTPQGKRIKVKITTKTVTRKSYSKLSRDPTTLSALTDFVSSQIAPKRSSSALALE